MANFFHEPGSALFELVQELGIAIPSIEAAYKSAIETKETLKKKIENSNLLSGGQYSDRSVVAFGSLARNEFTGIGKSDLDWTLLIDGMTAIQDLDIVYQLHHLLSEEHKSPNPAGAFGKLSFSHELIHQIGGSDDTNTNTTQRLLLLLESTSLYGDAVRNRVIRNILSRYLLEDESFLSGKHIEHVPRFLLNDIARFWRIMAVDFQTKKRERNKKGFALRNIKLRFSRKLLFLAGLITCFSFSIWSDDKRVTDIWKSSSDAEIGLKAISFLEYIVDIPPLELMAKCFFTTSRKDKPVRELFETYDCFIGLLSDEAHRKHLENLLPEEMANDTVYQTARNASQRFQRAIEEIFLSSTKDRLSNLTIKYGVF